MLPPEGHLAYYISDTVDALALRAFHARYAGGGPRTLSAQVVKLVREWGLVKLGTIAVDGGKFDDIVRANIEDELKGAALMPARIYLLPSPAQGGAE